MPERGSIGLPTGVALYLGAVLGAGVLVLPGAAAAIAGPASVLAWVLVCGLSIPIALTFARLAAQAPDPGGVAGYGSRAFGPATGAVVGWFYFTAVGVGQAVVTLTGAYYVAEVAQLGDDGQCLIAAAFLLMAMGANLAGLRFGGTLQLILAAAIAALLAVSIAVAVPRLSGDAFSPFAPEGFTSVGRAAVPLLFAFFGWEAITHLSMEFRNPGSDIQRATRVALIVVIVLYLGLALAVVGTGSVGSDQGQTAVSDLLAAGLGTTAGTTGAIVAACITLATANTFIAAGGRLGFALARDNAFPRALARCDARGTPRRAVVAVSLLAGAALAASRFADIPAGELVLIPSTLGLATYIVGTAAAIRLLPSRRRGMPVLALMVCLLIAPFAAGSLAAPVVVATMALLFLRWVAHRRPPGPKAPAPARAPGT